MTENKQKRSKDGRDLHIFIFFYLPQQNKMQNRETTRDPVKAYKGTMNVSMNGGFLEFVVVRGQASEQRKSAKKWRAKMLCSGDSKCMPKGD